MSRTATGKATGDGTILSMAADYTVVVRCTICKGEDHLQLQGYDEERAKSVAALLDGTSPFYVHSPRDEDSSSVIARCVSCGGILDAEVVQA